MLSLLLILALTGLSLGQDSCNPRVIDGSDKRVICVCNENHCSHLNIQWPQKSGQTYLIESTKFGKRFNASELTQPYPKAGGEQLDIDLNIEHQEILGWGGAFTDAAVINMNNVSDQLRIKMLESYYGVDGLQYNFGRVPIGGSDFSARAYTYDDSTDNFDLSRWQLAKEDLNFRIPIIKKAMDLVNQTGMELKLFASPWSAPKWMKTSNSLVQGQLLDSDQVFRAYTNYLMKFYDAYEQHGIKFWGATVQNEPVSSSLPTYFFNSMEFSNSDMIKLISKYLGPALAKRGMTKDKFKLMIGDDSLGFVNFQVPEVMRDKEVQKYVSGLAFHWYTSGTLVPYSLLSLLYNRIKSHIEFVIMTEACIGSVPGQIKVDLGSWERGESYASDIIEDLHRHTGAWIDWNLALNMQGGPNWAKNYVDSPIVVDSERDEFYKQPMYYALAHFSRFFRPGSVRLGMGLRTGRGGLSAVAAHKKDSGHLVVTLLNRSARDRFINLRLRNATSMIRRAFSVEARSISTLLLKL